MEVQVPPLLFVNKKMVGLFLFGANVCQESRVELFTIIFLSIWDMCNIIAEGFYFVYLAFRFS